MNILEIKSLEEIHLVAKDFIEKIEDKKIFALYGDMGVGKTTFIKAVCEVLKVEDTITSPTFAIVNEYHTLNKTLIYHFDFYRIEDVNEAYDFGYEDYFYGGNLCFIEWPERIESILPKDTVNVHFVENADGTRTIKF